MILTIKGCGAKIQKVPQKCITPKPDKPTIDNEQCTNLLDSSKQCLSNYTKMKAYAIKLEEANRVCQ